MLDMKWSQAEKKIARRIFDDALSKELAAILARLKEQAVKARLPDDIWAIHDYLTERRKGIDRKYDFRYSQLIFVFAELMKEGWINQEDIEALAEEKRLAIRHLAEL